MITSTSPHRWRQPRYSISTLMLLRRLLRRWPLSLGFAAGLSVGRAWAPPAPALTPTCTVLAGPALTVTAGPARVTPGRCADALCASVVTVLADGSLYMEAGRGH